VAATTVAAAVGATMASVAAVTSMMTAAEAATGVVAAMTLGAAGAMAAVTAEAGIDADHRAGIFFAFHLCVRVFPKQSAIHPSFVASRLTNPLRL